MRVRLIRRPGDPGTKRLVAKYGAALLCVRYRYDAEQHKRYKTVELIVETVDWQPPEDEDRHVAIRIAWHETDLRRAVKATGGRWHPKEQVWELTYADAKALELLDRVVEHLLYSA